MSLSDLDEFSWITEAQIKKSQRPSIRVSASWTVLLTCLFGFWAALTVFIML